MGEEVYKKKNVMLYGIYDFRYFLKITDSWYVIA